MVFSNKRGKNRKGNKNKKDQKLCYENSSSRFTNDKYDDEKQVFCFDEDNPELKPLDDHVQAYSK